MLRAFGSKDELVYEASACLGAAGVPLRVTPAGDVAAAVSAIFEVYETIGDLVIRCLADDHRRPQLLPLLDRARDNHRALGGAYFAPQLERRRGGARTQLFNVLVVATDVAVWNVLRRDSALVAQPRRQPSCGG